MMKEFLEEIIDSCNITHDISLKNNALCSYSKLEIQTFHDMLILYRDTLENTRHSFNIIGKNEDIEAHIIDSLAALPIFVEQAKVLIDNVEYNNSPPSIYLADLGTGAGLPGIPLALAFACLKITSTWYLIERSEKKAGFLTTVCEVLHTMNRDNFLTPVHIEIVAKNLREWTPTHTLNLVCSRAFRPLDDILSDMKKISHNASLIFYKGKMTSIDEEFSPHTPHNLLIENIFALTHQEDKERHIVLAKWS